tara:strand:- start:293 stop:1066 length:774 start_codon:yes stop_codon:yes gene_type:complete
MSTEKINKIIEPTNQKAIREKIIELIGISKKENEVHLSRRDESFALFKLLNIVPDKETGIDYNPLCSSLHVLKQKFKTTGKAIEKTMFTQWCSIVDAKNPNKGSQIGKNGDTKIGEKTINLSYDFLYSLEKSNILKESMEKDLELRAFLMEETDLGNGTGLKVQFKKWRDKEWNKIKRSVKPENNTGKNSTVLTPSQWIDKKVFKLFSNVKSTFKSGQGVKFDLDTINYVNTELATFEKDLKELLESDTCYSIYMKK